MANSDKQEIAELAAEVERLRHMNNAFKSDVARVEELKGRVIELSSENSKLRDDRDLYRDKMREMAPLANALRASRLTAATVAKMVANEMAKQTEAKRVEVASPEGQEEAAKLRASLTLVGG